MNVKVVYCERVIGVLHLKSGHFVAIIGCSLDGPIVCDPQGDGTFVQGIWFWQYLETLWDDAAPVCDLK